MIVYTLHANIRRVISFGIISTRVWNIFGFNTGADYYCRFFNNIKYIIIDRGCKKSYISDTQIRNKNKRKIVGTIKMFKRSYNDGPLRDNIRYNYRARIQYNIVFKKPQKYSL